MYIAYLDGPGSCTGEAELNYTIVQGRTTKKEFQVSVRGGPPGAAWDVAIDGVVVGRITLGDGGGMEGEWSTKHGSFPAHFPGGAGAGSVVRLGDDLAGKLESRTRQQ